LGCLASRLQPEDYAYCLQDYHDIPGMPYNKLKLVPTNAFRTSYSKALVRGDTRSALRLPENANISTAKRTTKLL
jgi:hypothetical protein